jgi:hypothetical protein
MLGCDPEFFFADSKSGKVIGSEKILKKSDKERCLVIDGVQAELNPAPSFCRQLLAGSIQTCFIQLRNALKARGIDAVVKVDSLVDITQAELDSLSEGCQVFGCAPSTNIYSEGENKTSKIKVDAKKYLKRSAGGHIHLGNAFSTYLNQTQFPEHGEYAEYVKIAKRIEQALKKSPDIMIAVLDIVVGNTCVLMDRSEGNKERRANYGRAGEYRLKPYGIEYRSLSNFWLRSYQLMSFVTGLCRFAVHCVSESTPENDYVKALFDAVPRKDIVKAINENNFELALENFKKLEDIFLDAADEATGRDYYPIRRSNIKLFNHFVSRIQVSGIDYWFPQDPLTHWTNNYNDKGGWETFSLNTINDDMCRNPITKLVGKTKKSFIFASKSRDLTIKNSLIVLNT